MIQGSTLTPVALVLLQVRVRRRELWKERFTGNIRTEYVFFFFPLLFILQGTMLKIFALKCMKASKWISETGRFPVAFLPVWEHEESFALWQGNQDCTWPYLLGCWSCPSSGSLADSLFYTVKLVDGQGYLSQAFEGRSVQPQDSECRCFCAVTISLGSLQRLWQVRVWLWERRRVWETWTVTWWGKEHISVVKARISRERNTTFFFFLVKFWYHCVNVYLGETSLSCEEGTEIQVFLACLPVVAAHKSWPKGRRWHIG